MEANRTKTQNGEELSIPDWNATCATAAFAGDHVLAELFRPAPQGGPAKGIIPYAYYGADGTNPPNTGIIESTLTTSPTLLVYPFRAVIGSPQVVPTVSPQAMWQGARSVVVAGTQASYATLPISVDLDPTVADNRCDLIYCKVTLDFVSDSNTRYLRDPATGVITHPSLPLETVDVATIGVVTGTEATNPTPPSLPADSGSDYYIPLAYVYLQHPTAGSVSKNNIHEIAPVIPLSRATGAATMQPGNSQWDPSMATLTGAPFTITSHRPEAYIPPTMCGMESRIFAFNWDHSPKTPAIGTPAVIDDTIDWRNRIFWTHVFAHGGGTEHFAWGIGVGGNVPTTTPSLSAYGAAQIVGMGQSFRDDDPTSSLVPSPAGFVVRLTSTTLTNLANPVYLYVDLSTGKLMVSAPVDPAALVLVRIDASGPFPNGGA